MTFAEALTHLPFTARQPNATGFLPPIFRTMGHLSLVLAVVADEDDTSMTDDDLLAELEHARGHWGSIAGQENLSAATRQAISNVGDALNATHDEWATWERKDRIKNIRDLSNRVVGFSAALDRELVALRDSDAGTQL